MPHRSTRVDDFANRDVLDDIAFGLNKAAVLKAAIELEIFTRIAEAHRTVSALARIVGANEHGIRVLLDALAYFGLLIKQHNEYRLSPTAEAFLVKGKPSYYGDAELGELAWEARGQLSRILKTGRPLSPAAFSEAYEATWAGVAGSTLADWQRQMESAGALWDKIGITAENAKPIRLLDVACGTGVVALALAKRNPAVRVTGIDRPMVLSYARQLAELIGVSSQAVWTPGDVLDLEVRKEAFELVLVRNISGYLSPEQNLGLFRRAFESLVPDGRVVVNAPVADEDHKGPGEVPVSAVEMLLSSPEGDTYTVNEYRGMLETAGFSEVTPIKDDLGLITARRVQTIPPKADK